MDSLPIWVSFLGFFCGTWLQIISGKTAYLQIFEQVNQKLRVHLQATKMFLPKWYFSFLLWLVFSTGSRWTAESRGREAALKCKHKSPNTGLPVALQPTLYTTIVSQCSLEDISSEKKTPRINSKAPSPPQTDRTIRKLFLAVRQHIEMTERSLCEIGGRRCNITQLLLYVTIFLMEKVACNTTVRQMHC